MFHKSILLLSACATVHSYPQVLTLDQFKQEGRSLDVFPGNNVVIVSPSYRQVRRYPFINDEETLNAVADNHVETNEIEEKIRKVNEALDKEIKKEEEQLVQELFESELSIENVLNEIQNIESELEGQTLEEDFEVDVLDISSFVNTRNIPLELLLVSDGDEAAKVDFELIRY
eukprot:GFUD01037977.1.p1 GENE.GFUD01037977.1~~GFUD01037977.1.p1  ORF type:complete len:173 (+),score=47.96 GFUD01037977.1:37-555(+)